MAQLNANLSEYDTQEGFDCLPPGWYPARIADSEIKSGPKGPYINWTFEIIGHPNRVWDVMSLGNEVSLRRLKTLATVAGHSNPNFIKDTEELHGLECQVKLKIEHDDSGQYDDKNKVSALKPLEGKSVNLVSVDTQSSAKPQKMPWEV
jgi:beta-xylosidase